MRLGSFPTLLLAAALSSPALWHAIVARDIDAKTALSRFLIAVPIAWITAWLARAFITELKLRNGAWTRTAPIAT